MQVDVDAARLRDFSSACGRRLGLAQDVAELLADSLVQSDLWGHPSHGVMRLFWYGTRLQNGAIKAEARPKLEVDAGAIGVIDGDDGLGQVMAAEAMRLAVDKAKAHGVGAVAVRRSGHFGTAMYYTRQAAAAGCLAILTTNASPSMAPIGGREKRVGNNPWSIAAPAGRFGPMVLDMANTAVARGKLYAAKARGEPIPDGWATDADGAPTTDPEVGIAGIILPMAGHKGYVISVMMDVMSGVLAGGSFGSTIVGPYAPHGVSGAGHCAIALNISAFRPLAAFEADMERLVEELKATPKAVGASEIFFPGELESRAAAAAGSTVSLPSDVVEELNRGADEIGAPRL